MLDAEDPLTLELDDGRHEGALVGEVVVELRGADAGGGLNVFDRRPGHPAFLHQIGGNRDDPVPGLDAFAGQAAAVDGSGNRNRFWLNHSKSISGSAGHGADTPTTWRRNRFVRPSRSAVPTYTRAAVAVDSHNACHPALDIQEFIE